MKNRLGILAVFLLVLAACAGTAATTTDAPTVTSAAPPTTLPAETTSTAVGLGTADNPIQVLFVPSVEADVIISGGEVMKAALEEATGLTFEVSVPDFLRRHHRGDVRRSRPHHGIHPRARLRARLQPVWGRRRLQGGSLWLRRLLGAVPRPARQRPRDSRRPRRSVVGISRPRLDLGLHGPTSHHE